MGSHAKITRDSFPSQGDLLGHRVQVCFHFDATKQIGGLCVRDDRDDPFVTIFRLDDGRHVLSTECQYRQHETDKEAEPTQFDEALERAWEKAPQNPGYWPPPTDYEDGFDAGWTALARVANRLMSIDDLRPLVDELRLMVGWRAHNAAVKSLRILVQESE